MSYQKYIKYKEEIKAELSLESYEDHIKGLLDKMSKSGARLSEIRLKEEAESILESSQLPQKESIKIAIFSGREDRLENCLDKLEEYHELKKDSGSIRAINLIESFKRECHLEIKPEDIKESIDSHIKYYKNKLLNIARKVEQATQAISWRNKRLRIEGIPEKDSLSLERAAIFINDEKSIIFEIKSFNSTLIKGSRYYSECSNLLKEIQSSEKKEKISTFYVVGKDSNKLMESIKKETCLGIVNYLPEGTIVTKEDNGGAWRVRIDECNLIVLEDKYIVGSKEPQIRFIEKL